MSRRYKGGVISATAPTTSTSSATGVWTLPQQMVAQAAGTWPTQPFDFLLNLYPGAPTSLATSSSDGSLFLASGSHSDGYSRIAKYNVEGVIQWQKRYIGPGCVGNTITGIFLNSSNELLVTAQVSPVVLQIQKINSSTGALIWQKSINLASGCSPGFVIGPQVSCDAAGNVYVAVSVKISCTQGVMVAVKLNSSGVFQWSANIGNNFGSALGATADVNGNFYVCAKNNSDTSARLIKINTSGVPQWQRSLQVENDPCLSGNTGFSRVVADSAGDNVYVVGTGSLSYTVRLVLAKYNSSGTLQWNRTFSTGNPVSSNEVAISIDGSSNVYVTGNVTSDYKFFMAKYNSSGTLQWQRTVISATRRVTGSTFSAGLSGTSPAFLAPTTNLSSADIRQFLAKLPSDGSKTGTYVLSGVTWVYAASNFSDASFTGVYASPGISYTSPTYTLSDTSYADSASSLTTATTSLT